MMVISRVLQIKFQVTSASPPSLLPSPSSSHEIIQEHSRNFIARIGKIQAQQQQ
jgi:hypothetical protein